MPMIFEQVSAVVPPTLATCTPNAGVIPTQDAGDGGQPGAPLFGTPFVCVEPRNRILPEESTWPLTTCASAASTLGNGPVSRLKNSERLATVLVPVVEQAEGASIILGWLMASPAIPESLFAST